MNHMCLLGRDVLCCDKIKVSIDGGTVNKEAVENKNNDLGSENEILNIDVYDYDKNKNSVQLNVDSNLDSSVKQQLENDLVQNYLDCEKFENPVTDLKMKIVIKENHNPFYITPRRMSYSDKIEVKKIVKDLENRKIIKKSNSPYSLPIVLVKRKNKIGMCIDYRHLSKLTQRDNFPLPIVDEQIEFLRDKKYFTKLDLKDAFHHVTLDDDSVKYMSFVTPMGQYEYLKMPFGLKNSPAMFSRYVTTAFRELLDQAKIAIYIDDIIPSLTIQKNLNVLNEVYQVLISNCLTLRLDKCSFLKTKIDYLGYKISFNVITPNSDNVNSIMNFPVPTNLKMVQSFIGLASYFRRFVNNFAIVAKPLYEMLKKCNAMKDFCFGTEQFKAFEEIKSKLCESPILSIYSPKLETELHCDASAIGFSSILMQKQSDNLFHPVFYFSRRTTETESKLHSFELELLAIVYSLERFRIYLKGISFKIVTDCNSLQLA